MARTAQKKVILSDLTVYEYVSELGRFAFTSGCQAVFLVGGKEICRGYFKHSLGAVLGFVDGAISWHCQGFVVEIVVKDALLDYMAEPSLFSAGGAFLLWNNDLSTFRV